MNIRDRLRKIEKKLQPEKGEWLKFPDGEGGYIEVPGRRTLLDVIALAQAQKHKQKMNETERK